MGVLTLEKSRVKEKDSKAQAVKHFLSWWKTGEFKATPNGWR